ncbi:MAG: hypothetical protein U1E66_11000 [Rhodospirillales bacterium]
MKTLGLVAASLIAAVGLTGPAAADGWGYSNPPPGFDPPPRVSLFMGNAPSAFYRPPPPPRRYCPPPGYGYAPRYRTPPGYGYGPSRYVYRDGGRSVIIVTR